MRTRRSAVVIAAATSLVAIAAWGAAAAEPQVEPADAVLVAPANPGTFTAGASLAPGRLVWGADGPGSATIAQREVTGTSPLSLGHTTKVLGPSQYPDVVGDGRRTAFQANGAGLATDDGETTKVVDTRDTYSQPQRMSGHRVAEGAIGASLFNVAAGAWDSYDATLVHWGAVGAASALRPDVNMGNYVDHIDLDTLARTRWFTSAQVGLSAAELLRPVGMSSELVVFERHLLTGEVLGLGWFNWRTGGHGLIPDSEHAYANLSVYSTFVTVLDYVSTPKHASVFDTRTGQRVLDLDGYYFLRLGSSGVYWSNWANGEAKAASLPGVRAPVHEGNPIASKSYAPLSNKPWTAEFAFSEPLTTCSVEMSTAAGGLLKTLPCDPRWTRYGEASVAWDGRAANGIPLAKGTYRWALKASGAGGPAQASPGSGALTGSLAVEDDRYVAITPVRLVDNRKGTGDITTAPVPGGSVTEVKVAGVGSIPATATTAVLNVTIVSPDHDGYATVDPSGTPRPSASNLNFGFQGPTTANQVISRIGANGRISIFVSDRLAPSYGGSMVVDLAGYYSTTPRFVSTTPTRLLDTRKTVRVPAGGKVDVQVAGRAGIPASGASAAALNVTALGGTGQSGYLTVWPAGAPRPAASNLNYNYGSPQPALAITKLGTAGKVSIYSSAASEVLVDVSGWFPATSDLRAVAPARLLDTRSGVGAPKAPIGKGKAVSVQVTGRGGVPTSGVKAVVLNVTATRTQSTGYLSAYPSGSARPNTSVVNYGRDKTIANSVIAKVGVGGKVDIFSWAGADAVVDVQGYVLN